EHRALALTERHILPDLLRARADGASDRRVRILRRVTLGAARVEFDQLVVRVPAAAGRPVQVLAAVEVKKNINDLAHGFRLRQENLAWLTGDAGGYDPALYRTGHFRSGHFDRPAEHREGGDAFLFAPGSFRRFRRE